jgi:hypothetical protein
MIIDLVFGLVSGYTFGYLWERCTTKTNLRRLTHFESVHFHHSLLGLIAVLVSFIFRGRPQVIVLCFGLGIIVEHSIREGFLFITKDKK